VIVGGIYIAIDPAVYRDGLIKLFPIDWHPQIRVTLTMAPRRCGCGLERR